MLVFALIIMVLLVIFILDFSSGDVLIYGQPDSTNSSTILMAVDTAHGLTHPFLPFRINGIDTDLSIDGQKIAFISGLRNSNQINVWDITTHQTTHYPFLETRPTSLEWSADDNEIIYTTTEGTTLGIIDLGTGEQQTLVATQDYEFFLPTLSPDGMKAAYFRVAANRNELCLLDRQTLRETCVDAVYATWSPNGEYLVIGGRVGESENYAVYQMDIETGEITPLLLDSSGSLSFYDPRWSPDGNQIVVNVFDISAGTTYLNVINTEGELLNQINTNHEAVWAVVWSSDSERLAYLGVNFVSNDSNLRVYDLNHQQIALPLTDIEIQPRHYFQPVWWPPLQ